MMNHTTPDEDFLHVWKDLGSKVTGQTSDKGIQVSRA
jgi:hypothetical protein